MNEEQKKKVEKIIKDAQRKIEAETGLKVEASQVTKNEFEQYSDSIMSLSRDEDAEEALERMEDVVKGMGVERKKEKDEGIVERSIPAKAEWIAKDKEMDRTMSEIQNLARKTIKNLKDARMKVLKLESMRRSFWGDIEQDLEIYDRKLRFNTERGEVEVFMSKKDEKKKKPVKSPIQMN